MVLLLRPWLGVVSLLAAGCGIEADGTVVAPNAAVDEGVDDCAPPSECPPPDPAPGGQDSSGSPDLPDEPSDEPEREPDDDPDDEPDDEPDDDPDEPDQPEDPPDPALTPESYVPCQNGDCWRARSFAGACGVSTLREDFSTGRYNVHEFAVFLPAEVAVEITVETTGGDWSPVLILQDDEGLTVHDGERSLLDDDLTIEPLDDGLGPATTGLRLLGSTDTELSLFLTDLAVIDGDFLPRIPTRATYTLTVFVDCVRPTGDLLSPPNFDADDREDGYYLLPPSEPPGLYERKSAACSRGTKLLIDVLYTVAHRWASLRPDLSPLLIRDMNKGPCGTGHETHGDGTHVDLVAGCATQAACGAAQAAIDLAKLLVDTGSVCGIIFDDDPVRGVINEYFTSMFDYEVWHRGEFMRNIGGHGSHFHFRVMKPDGTCN